MIRNIAAAVFAVVMAVLMLLLRELILWHGRKKRDYEQAQADAPGDSLLEIRKDEVAYKISQSEFEEPAPSMAFINVEEFLAELRAESQIPAQDIAKNQANLEYSIISRR